MPIIFFFSGIIILFFKRVLKESFFLFEKFMPKAGSPKTAIFFDFGFIAFNNFLADFSLTVIFLEFSNINFACSIVSGFFNFTYKINSIKRDRFRIKF